ncbi:hypothetical protein [Georgenia ruanii]|uniref:hypothetical protein n=1 Tax=Georgenia ruanii TaxID=348442 RepID=UPI0012640F7A|nr:hypothetical protein [Georgenia ruanii]
MDTDAPDGVARWIALCRTAQRESSREHPANGPRTVPQSASGTPQSSVSTREHAALTRKHADL